MKRPGVVQRTCAILADLMRGTVHDRHSLARSHGVALAAADRYLRHLLDVPGVEEVREGRQLSIRWWPRESPEEQRMRMSLSHQSREIIVQLARLGIYGATTEEVIVRFIDEGIQRFVTHPVLVPRAKEGKR